jgi:hypothetical protein
MPTDDYANAIEQVYKDALGQADQIIANANQVKQQALAELDAARELHKTAEKEAGIMADKYFEGRINQFKEATRTELLRQIARRLLENGKPVEEIAGLLDQPTHFIRQIEEVLQRLQKYFPESGQLKGNPRLQYINKGRGGTVIFENGPIRFDMWWEFGWGEVVVFVDIPTEKDWVKKTGISITERNETLQFIGARIIQDQLSGSGTFIIGENTLTFYSRA